MYIVKFNIDGQIPGYLTVTSAGLSVARDINMAIGFQTERQAEYTVRSWMSDDFSRKCTYKIEEL